MISYYTKIKTFFWTTLKRASPFLFTVVFRFRVYVKYLVSGGSAAVANLSLLSLLVEIFHVHYLLASILAFLAGFLVSFFMQKYFTFGDTALKAAHRQLILYLFITVANLGFNTLLVYVFVDMLGVWYFGAQLIAGIIVAAESFFLYRRFVFNRDQRVLESTQ
ncbi:MAG: hypothetical protein A2664_00885 [Candidatus Taylorbacteria bacterium RIFCSPHIGHO2_01_FULL_46_22b]|uniref:GtrA/DPMS transmembrane domain-containing protein n=1 Tax=Candidatus Taylorbacteria bacterium RIFCSPHIGHO2_01_FULL_46_22b TaxID=1802301 RepID=A0A1G2M3Z7_9BACT|nr:MAG: hypothetical protein A2664_00885 [Candidatus Taylorbacteria bacterium RIFCSPHIGHO2_01_FULL_46_22b]